MIMDLINKGVIPGDKGLEMLDMPNMRSYYAVIKVDENQANRENIRLRSAPVEEIQMARQEAEMQKQQYLEQMGMDESMAREDPVVAQLLDQLDRPILPVNDWDNHEIHIYRHQFFMKSQAFEMLDPVLQEEFVKHVQAHKSAQQSQALTEMMMGGTTGGQPQDMGEMMQGMGGGQGELPAGQPPQESGQGGGGNQFSGIEQGAQQPAG